MPLPLPAGIRSRHVDNGNGLVMHLLEAGYETADRPCVILLHGFPELAYTWRRIMPPLAAAGYHVVAPDQRGYGLTTGWDNRYEADLGRYRPLNLVRDVIGLLQALGRRSAAAIVGHDFGSPVAAYCALIRPDLFRSAVLMSAPFAGPPAFPFNTADGGTQSQNRSGGPNLHAGLDALDPPRKHYQWYNGTPQANADMLHCSQGLHAFLRAYFHYKSADWAGNTPEPLRSAEPRELARMPHYYIMERDRTMAETVAPHMPDAARIAACTWLPDEELRVYTESFARTGFQGGLHWYRASAQPGTQAELRLYAGRTLDVPACFMTGSADWGTYQSPGSFERMRDGHSCTRLLGCHFIDGAGHWVQQEQAEAVGQHLLAFLQSPEVRDAGQA